MTAKTMITVAAVVASTALSAVPAAAVAPPAVSVTANPDTLAAPGVDALRPGASTFTVSTVDARSRYVAVVGLKPGVALDGYLNNMATVLFSQDEEAKRLAGAQVRRDLALHAGVAVSARAAQGVTVVLPAGSYYLIDYTSLGSADRHWLPVTVSGARSSGHPRADGIVVQYQRDPGQLRYLASTRLAPRGTLQVVNATGNLHEAVFLPVLPGTTDADLDRYFAGQGPSPIIGGPQGILPIIGGQTAMLHLDLAPGRYVVTSWVVDGVPDVARGMHQVIDVG